MTRLLASIVFAVAAVCALATTPQQAFDEMAVVDKFVWDSVKPFYTTTTDRIRQYSQLKSEKKRTNPDGTTSYTFLFTGLVVSGLDVPSKGFFLQSLEVTTANYPLASDIKVGSPIAEVKVKLGAPIKATSKTLTFQGETEQVVFSVANDAVSKAVFHVYTD